MILEFIGKLLRLLSTFSGYNELNTKPDGISDDPIEDNNGEDSMLIDSPKMLSDNVDIEIALAKEVIVAMNTGVSEKEISE